MVERKQSEELTHLGRLARQCVQDSERWFGDSPVVYSVEHHSLVLASLTGKFCGVIEKIQRGSLDPKDAKVRMQLAMDLTDVYTRVLMIAGLLNIDLDKAYQQARGNNERKFTEERTQRENKVNGQR